MRVYISISLVLLIVVIAVCPFFDLPLTTVRAQQAALNLLTIVSLCWVAAAIWQQLRFAERWWTRGLDVRELDDRRLLGMSCALRC